jgi:hypothetical protein
VISGKRVSDAVPSGEPGAVAVAPNGGACASVGALSLAINVAGVRAPFAGWTAPAHATSSVGTTSSNPGRNPRAGGFRELTLMLTKERIARVITDFLPEIDLV